MLLSLFSLAMAGANALQLCRVRLQAVDYREQLDGQVYRELMLQASVDMIAPGPSFIKKMLGSTLRVCHGRRVIFKKVIDSDIDLSKGVRIQVPAGPRQQIDYSYFDPKFEFWVEVFRPNHRRAECATMLRGNILQERQERIGEQVCRESPGEQEYNEKFLINRGQQPFTLEEVQVISEAVTRAELAFDLEPQAVDLNDLPEAVENLQTRARHLNAFLKNNGATAGEIDQHALAYLGRSHRKYTPARAWKYGATIPIHALISIVGTPFYGMGLVYACHIFGKTLPVKMKYGRRLLKDAGENRWSITE